MYQRLTIVGRLGRDVELRFTAQGKAVANFSVAVDRYRGPDEPKDVDWFRVTVWGNAAEACNTYLHKGDIALVEGTVSLNTYTKRDGTAGANMDVTAQTVRFIQTRRDDDMAGVARRDILEEEEIPFSPGPALLPRGRGAGRFMEN